MKKLYATLIRAMIAFALFFGHIIGESNLMGQVPDSTLFNFWESNSVFKIYDRFGNEHDYEDIVQQKKSIENCIGHNIIFEIDYVDEATNDFGFGNATYGDDAKVVLCQVLKDLSHLIVVTQNPCDGSPPIMRLEVREEQTPPGYFASASSYYYNFSDAARDVPDIVYGSVWKLINGGADPTIYPEIGISLGDDVNHALINVNFHESIGYSYDLSTFPPAAIDLVNNNNIDFYQVILHEVMHILGFASWLDSDGTSKVGNDDTGAGLYTRYDKYLMDLPTGTNAIFHNVLDGCYAYQYNSVDLTNDCNIYFNGVENTVTAPVYAPDVWDDSSLSHFYNNCSTGNYYLMHPSMVGDAIGLPIRVPTPEEAQVLCELGYQLTGNYGDPDAINPLYFHFSESGPFSLYTCSCEPDCNYAALVDDQRPVSVSPDLPCTANVYTKTACDPITINFADLVDNDYNITTIDPNCLEVIIGNGSITVGANNFTFMDGSIGWNVIRYIDDGTAPTANTGWIYVDVTPCADLGCTPDPMSCNLICNPSVTPCGVAEPCFSMISSFALPTSLCNPFPGWAALYNNPGYSTIGCLPPGGAPFDEGVLLLFAGNLGPLLGGSQEGTFTSTNIIEGENYLLSFYIRRDGINPDGGDVLSNFVVNLSTNTDFTAVGLPNFSAPIIDPPNFQNVYGTTPFPYQDNQFHQIVTCFSATQDWDRLYFYPVVPFVWYSGITVYLDHIQLIEDDFAELFEEDITIPLDCGSCTDLGASICSEIEHLAYRWEVFDEVSGIWQVILGETEPLLEGVCDILVPTQYRLTRYMDTAIASVTVDGTECIDASVIFTVEPPASCCDTSPDLEDIDTPQELVCCLSHEDIIFDHTDNESYTVGDGSTLSSTILTWADVQTDMAAAFGLAPLAGAEIINGTLIIPRGITLTITNQIVRFGPWGRIIVQNGATLVMNDNATLTGTCNTVWQGIRVNGPGTGINRAIEADGFFNFGIVDLIVGTIEDAIIGVAAMNFPLIDVNELAMNTIPSFDFNYYTNFSTQFLYTPTTMPTLHLNTGGVCITRAGQGVNFLNCYEGIALGFYRNTNYGSAFIPFPSIQGATFNSDGLKYPFSTAPVSLNTESGIHCIRYEILVIGAANEPSLGNHFEDIKYGTRGIFCNYIGIHSNTVEHCSAGISFVNTNVALPNNPLFVKNNTMNDCIIGVQAAGANIALQGNTFNNANEMGVFLRGCTFTMDNTNVFNTCLYGVALVSNTLSGSFIENNQYLNCGVPIWSFGDNVGVQVACNWFENYVAAGIIVSDYTIGGSLIQVGNFDDQGVCNPLGQVRPANNTFMPSGIVIHDIFSEIAVEFDYEYSPEPNFLPTVNTTTVMPQLCTAFPDGGGICPNLEPPMEGGEIIAIIDENLLNKETIKKVIYYVDEQNEVDSAILLLEDVNTIMADRMLATHYIYTGDYAAADQKLNDLPDNTLDDTYFKQFAQIEKTLEQEGRQWHEMTVSEETMIRNIALSTTKTAYNAQAVLYLAYGEEYPLELADSPSILAQNSNLWVNFKAENLAKDQVVSKLYPNPSNNFVSMDYNLANEQIATLDIYNMSGILVSKHSMNGKGKLAFSINELVSGIYYYEVNSTQGILTRDKLLVIK